MQFSSNGQLAYYSRGNARPMINMRSRFNIISAAIFRERDRRTTMRNAVDAGDDLGEDRTGLG